MSARQGGPGCDSTNGDFLYTESGVSATSHEPFGEGLFVIEKVDPVETVHPLMEGVMESLLDPFVILEAVRDERGKVIDFRYTEANNVAIAYNQTTRAELIGSRLLEMLPGHAGSGLFDMYVHTVETGEPLVLDDFQYPNEIVDSDRFYDIRAVKLADSLAYTWRDVTLFNRALEEFRLLAEHASDIVYRTDAHGYIEWISPSVTEALGWTPKELVGQYLGGAMHPDESALMHDRAAGFDPLGRAHFELRFRHAGGEYHWFSVTTQNVTDADGVVTARIGSLHNIDEERERREALLASEERYRLLAENSSDVITLGDQKGYLSFVSPAVTALLGWRPDELVGTRIRDIVHPDDMDIVRTAGSHHYQGQYQHVVIRLLVAGGGYRHVSAAVQELEVDGDFVRARIATWRDAEAEVQSSRALKRSEDRFRLLAENSSDVVLLENEEYVIEWASPSVTEVLGWLPEQIIGSCIAEFLSPEDFARTVEAGQKAHGNAARIVHRMRQSDGSFRWVQSRSKTVPANDGQSLQRVVTLHDAETEIESRELLSASESKFRLLAENASDIVYRTDAAGNVEWISPSMETELGWSVSEVLGTSLLECIIEEDVAKMDAMRSAVLLGEKVTGVEVRFQTRNHAPRWMSVHAQPLRGDAGKVVGSVVGLRVCHAEVVARRAFRTLSAGSRVLVRAEHEEGLLTQMCEAAVSEGGYLFAWYGRKIDDDRKSVAKVAMSRSHATYLDTISVSWGDDALGMGPCGRSIRTGDPVVMGDFVEETSFAPWREQAELHRFRSCISLPVKVDGKVDGAWLILAPEPNAFTDAADSALADLAAELGYGLQRLRDQARLAKSIGDHAMLAQAISQAGESFIVTDAAGSMIYVNPAVVETSGYDSEELIGENPRIFRSPLEDAKTFEDMWQTLLRGESWSGTLVNKRKDGNLYQEECTISPVHDATGRLTAYVAVKHDLTKEIELQENLSREQLDRNAILSVMREVPAKGSLHDTAQTFCEAAIRLDSIDTVCLLLLQGNGQLLPIGISGSTLFNIAEANAFGVTNPEAWQLLDGGPLLIDMADGEWPSNEELFHQALDEGFRSVVLAAVRWEGSITGVLALGSKEPPDAVRSRLVHFEELGTYAGNLLGDRATQFDKDAQTRLRIRATIDEKLFHPVFQPFVDLTTGDYLGYEALTRFDDGVRPDLKFIEAATVGLGTELEATCAKAALEAAAGLAPGMFVSLNFSLAALLDGSAASAVENPPCRVVIELTEHEFVDNYDDLVAAVAATGCALAVDDMGRGSSGFQHIVELEPAYVKLDYKYVHDIHLSPTNHKMAAALCHFADDMGTVIIAECIETEEEAEVFRSLSAQFPSVVILGQGYLFARPEPLKP